jgi:hypothetical protein
MKSFGHTSRFAHPGVSRRTFVKGLAAGSAVAGLGLWQERAFAQGAKGNAPAAWNTLSGTDFDLRIGETRSMILASAFATTAGAC